MLDANDHLGGRVSQVEGLAPWPIQLGPEFIHGDENNALKDLCDELGFGYRTLDWPDRYYFGGEDGVGLVDADAADEDDPDVAETHALFADLPGAPGDDDDDVSALTWLTETVRASPRVVSLAESLYANDFGCSLSIMGMKETAIEQREWRYGEKYLVLDRSLREVAEALGRDVDVRSGRRVRAVETREDAEGESSGPRVTVRVTNGESFAARRCVMAAPITALKPDGPTAVAFDPPLSEEKRDAIRRVKTSNAVKVLLGFDEAFWPDKLWDVVCVDCFLPELWILDFPARPVPKAAAEAFPPGCADRVKHVVTFFACGELADRLSETPKEDIVNGALDQLDQMFGGKGEGSPSRARFVASHVADWSSVETAGGAYTYPTLHAAGSRAALAAPERDAVFFAGEATHVGVNPCMQGAMETGIRAADEVLKSLGRG